MQQFVLRMAALAALAFVIFSTVGPVGLRPHMVDDAVQYGANLERFLAYLMLSVLFVWAFPRQVFFVVAVILLTAACLEVLQGFIPGRHAEALDVIFKMLGAIVGLQLGILTRNRVAVRTGS